jgi:hypothetical protein
MNQAMAAPLSVRQVLALSTLLIIFDSCAPALARPVPLNDAPVPGWPELEIATHYVARIAMRGSCFPVPAGTPIPETGANSCARPDFWRGVCDIYIDVQHVASVPLYEHEVRRCRGYDYRGSDAFAEALRVWRERGENRYADMLDFESIMFVWDPATKCREEDAACIEIR